MDLIFHEKQEGCLCAQHCLNALLQGPYFTPVDLATLAHQLDEQERERMAENGIDSDEYRNFIQQPSGNMDDSGFFSVQVITSALDVWNLEIVPYNSSEPRALEAQKSPQEMQAYICNYREHWFTIRRLGCQWFNLNSMLTGPQLISDTYLSVYLAQLQHEGYSIFVVFGSMPNCQAHDALLINPAVQSSQPKTVEISKPSKGHRLGSINDDPDLQKAISLSLGQANDSSPMENAIDNDNDDDNDDDFQRALRESMLPSVSNNSTCKSVSNDQKTDPLETSKEEKNTQHLTPSCGDDDDDDEEDLQKALRLSLQDQDSSENDFKRPPQMSLECVGNDQAPNSSRPSNIDLSEIRARRLLYLEGANNAQSAGKSSSN